MNATIGDATRQIILDIWNDAIPLEEGNIYTFSNISIHYWNGVRKLTTTTNSLIRVADDLSLKKIMLQETSDQQEDTTLEVRRKY